MSSALDPAIAGRLKRNRRGLVPAVVQQHDTGEVLMLGWMDDEALHRTLTTGRGTYWSRSRAGVLGQGRDLRATPSGWSRFASTVTATQCLLKVDQTGPACHTGAHSCFDDDVLLASERDA